MEKNILFEIDAKKRKWESAHSKRVYKQYCNYVFHYTTLDTFWKIVDGDKFLARNIRFSNDSEEYNLGEKYLKDFLKNDNVNMDRDYDYYMVCFCKQGNILSQWREYARGGVAIKFDMENQGLYSIVNKNSKEEKLKGKLLDGNNSLEENPNKEIILTKYAKPIEVMYAKEGNLKEINKKFNILKDESKDSSELKQSDFFGEMIPYIKHEGFKEEEEVRLIFNVEKDEREAVVNYISEEGRMKPSIFIKNGICQKDDYIEVIYNAQDVNINEIVKNIKDIKNDNIKMPDGSKKNIEFKKSTRIKTGEIIINNCTEQKKVFDALAHYVNCYNHEKNVNIKVWCDGHLPIREIIVGPFNNKEEVKESIEHYIRTKYWMTFVEVIVSDIPYREKKS